MCCGSCGSSSNIFLSASRILVRVFVYSHRAYFKLSGPYRYDSKKLLIEFRPLAQELWMEMNPYYQYEPTYIHYLVIVTVCIPGQRYLSIVRLYGPIR